MNQYLLDTHILLWWLSDDSRLSKTAREIIADPQNIIFTSVVSAWEISIKLGSNPDFKISVDIDQCFAKELGFRILPIQLEHTLGFQKLEKIHKDPFDRMLIAQAIVEDFIVLSADKKIQQYSKVAVMS